MLVIEIFELFSVSFNTFYTLSESLSYQELFTTVSSIEMHVICIMMMHISTF